MTAYKATIVFMNTLSAFAISVLTAISCLSLLSFSSVALSQNEGRWYQVEILIFKRHAEWANAIASDNSESRDDEWWRNDIQLTYPEDAIYITETLPNTTHELGGHRYALTREDNYDVLFHQAWNQQMQGREDSPALIIRGGEFYGPHRELEGSIRIHIGRYLHVTTDLWLSELIIRQPEEQHNVDSTYIDNWPNLPVLQYKADISNEEESAVTNSYLINSYPVDYVPAHVITMREKRRMRSKETHYIDHPVMGILVRMLPIEAPTQSAAPVKVAPAYSR